MPMLEKPIAESYWVIPGFFLAGEYPAARMDDLQTRQRLAAFITAGFDTFLDLTCQGERDPYLKMMIEEARSIGLAVQYQRFSFPDFSVPTHAAMRSALNAIDAALTDHHRLYLHCVGGIGRTGTTVACHLIRHGMAPEPALEHLRDLYRTSAQSLIAPHSPEADEQVRFVLEWEEHGLA